MRVAGHFSVEELERLARECGEEDERRRWRLVWLVAVGETIKRASRIVGYDYSSGRRILKAYNRGGGASLKDRRRSRKDKLPRHSSLSPAFVEKLRARVLEPPPDGGLWTGPKLAKWIEQETGQKVWPQRGWDWLKRFGFRLRRPRRRHAKADQERQAEFKRELPKILERVRQEHPGAEVELWSFDEHRLGLKPILRRVWVAPGQEPIAPVRPAYQWLYLDAFVCPERGETFWLILPRVSTEIFSLALREFARSTGAGRDKHIVLVLDRAGWHISRDLEIPEGIHLVPLPPYSPELQPAERLWPLADEGVANQAIETLDHLEEKLVERCRALMSMLQAVRDLTLFHWWPRVHPASA
jgi:transposase